jgi:hypothetical protein
LIGAASRRVLKNVSDRAASIAAQNGRCSRDRLGEPICAFHRGERDPAFWKLMAAINPPTRVVRKTGRHKKEAPDCSGASHSLNLRLD